MKAYLVTAVVPMNAHSSPVDDGYTVVVAPPAEQDAEVAEQPLDARVREDTDALLAMEPRRQPGRHAIALTRSPD